MNIRLEIMDAKQKLSDLLLNTSHEELIDVVSRHLQELEKICESLQSPKLIASGETEK